MNYSFSTGHTHTQSDWHGLVPMSSSRQPYMDSSLLLNTIRKLHPAVSAILTVIWLMSFRSTVTGTHPQSPVEVWIVLTSWPLFCSESSLELCSSPQNGRLLLLTCGIKVSCKQSFWYFSWPRPEITVYLDINVGASSFS